MPLSMSRARTTLLLSAAALAALVPAAQAAGGTLPAVKSVTPVQASIPEVMTIQGSGFRPGRGQNVVVFVARNGRVSYVRADNATPESMTIRLPKKLTYLMDLAGGKRVPTRFRIKVIASRMGRVAAGALAQPTIGPDVGGDCDKDGTPNPVDGDDDNDVLSDLVEQHAKTDPCRPDSDGDNLGDGWEYWSAIDLNHNAVPYPAKRPFPNALFPDANIDYDGDGMNNIEEHAMWALGGRPSKLNYSDGDQTTDPERTDPARWWLDWDRDGQLSDEERDFDRDGLGNFLERHDIRMEPWDFPGVIRTDFLDWDTDGDKVADGPDDQDHDDISNLDELVRGTYLMNPCDPGRGRTCPRYVPTSMPVKPAKLPDSTAAPSPWDELVAAAGGGEDAEG